MDFRRKYNALMHVRPEKSNSIEVGVNGFDEAQRASKKAIEELLSCSLWLVCS